MFSIDILHRVQFRIYQRAMYLGMFFLKWREPERLESLESIPDVLESDGLQHPLIITDAGVVAAGLLDRLIDVLEGYGFSVYDQTSANPTIGNVEAAQAMYKQDACDCLIALGGGSPMDCAKAVGACVVNPRKTLGQMRGQLKVRKKLPTLIAIPTTAGTGSEATLAAVIADPVTREKNAINDPVLIPDYAVLDPVLTASMPRHITATTGMDALTHAIEAYIGKGNTKQTRSASLKAMHLINRHLYDAYFNGNDMKARNGMQRAAYLAGTAFTRAYVGYVHAIAHQLGALYGTPHGLANAILLPHVLEFYGRSIHRQLAEIQNVIGKTNAARTNKDKAYAVIDSIRALNRDMRIPEYADMIEVADIPRIVEGAYIEANPLYPVPKILDERELEALIRKVMGPQR